MVYTLLAYTTLILHLGFIAFVTLGGALVVRRPRWAWLHLPAAVWGFLTEWYRLPCPLTPLEVWALRHSGGEGYAGGFIDHYLLPLIYPEAMPVWLPTLLAVGVVVVNLYFYRRLWRRQRT